MSGYVGRTVTNQSGRDELRKIVQTTAWEFVGRLTGDETVGTILMGTSETVGLTMQDLNSGTNPNWEIPSTPAVLEIVSTSADDDIAGIGIQAVILVGLDANFNEQIEPIAMDGTTPATSALTWLALNQFFTFAYGPDPGAKGVITVTNTNDSLNWGLIPLGEDRAFLGRFTLPNTKSFHQTAVGWTTGAGGDFTIDIVSNFFKPRPTTVIKLYVHENTGTLTGPAIPIRSRQTLKLRAKRSTGGGGGSSLSAYVTGTTARNIFTENIMEDF